jgi:NitT/TauT family transport system ATP-binding protein
VIRVSDLTVGYPGKEVLRDVSFHIPAGTHAALMGPSGCGKTTLLRVLLGLQKPQEGSAELRGRASCLFQEPRLLPWCTVLQNVNAVLSDKKETLPEAMEWLRRVRLEEVSEQLPARLSGGERQRAALARALAYGGDMLLLDEPLKGQDEALKGELVSLLKEFCRERTLLLVTHDPAEAAALTEAVYVFRDGNIVLQK